jgi:hypothetical protein
MASIASKKLGKALMGMDGQVTLVALKLFAKDVLS